MFIVIRFHPVYPNFYDVTLYYLYTFLLCFLNNVTYLFDFKSWCQAFVIPFFFIYYSCSHFFLYRSKIMFRVIFYIYKLMFCPCLDRV